MGSSVQAFCPYGVEEEIMIGGGSLTDGTYKCPECEKMSLRFGPGSILWD